MNHARRVCLIIMKFLYVLDYNILVIYIFVSDFYFLYFWRFNTHKSLLFKILFHFLSVWIPFTLSRFTWLLWKFDTFKFINVHIFWILFQIMSTFSCWDIGLAKLWWSALFGFGLGRSLNFCFIHSDTTSLARSND